MLYTNYVLEVVKFISDKDGNDGWLSKNGKFEHLVYMKAKFKTKNDACSYYDRNNPHMRQLNAHGNYKSDWDPNTKLLYIVRKDYFINMTIDPFNINDLPINGEYQYLK